MHYNIINLVTTLYITSPWLKTLSFYLLTLLTLLPTPSLLPVATTNLPSASLSLFVCFRFQLQSHFFFLLVCLARFFERPSGVNGINMALEAADTSLNPSIMFYHLLGLGQINAPFVGVSFLTYRTRILRPLSYIALEINICQVCSILFIPHFIPTSLHKSRQVSTLQLFQNPT